MPMGNCAIEEFGDGGFGLAGAVTGSGGAVDFRGRKAVVVHDAVGPVNVFHVDEGAERNHFAGERFWCAGADVFGMQAIRGFGLHVDLLGAAETVEVVDVERAEINLHGVENIGERDAVGFCFFAVHVRRRSAER